MNNNIYKEIHLASEYCDILHNINNIYIPVDKNWKNIGITLSGGADSAILAYLVCSIVEKYNMDCKIHIVNNIRMWKSRPWQSYIFSNVFEYIKTLFPSLEFILHKNFVPPDLEWGNIGPSIQDEYGRATSGDIIELRSFGEYTAHYYNLDAGFLGVNKNPSVPFNNSPAERNITDDLTISDFMIKRDIMLVCHPFRHLEKDQIISLYKINRVEELLELTRSCEGDTLSYPDIFKGLDYKSYVPGQFVPECGECFWCNERKWGIDNAK